MKNVKITVVKKVWHKELSDLYENKIDNACDMNLHDTFVYDGSGKPEGLCQSAWESMAYFVEALYRGEENFYDGWMKNKKSAMISCNDGFRPVSFYIEVIE